jgi:hypothetical protein
VKASWAALSIVLGCGEAFEPRGDGSCEAALLHGDVVVSEIMADPAGADDGFEWLEIFNASGRAVELGGAVLRYRRADGTGEKGHVLEALSVEADAYAVLANAIDDAGVLPSFAGYGYGDALALGNEAGELSILCGDEVVDAAVYGEPTSGASRGLDGSRVPDAVDNDALAAWCDARAPFEEEALGSPGAANEACFGSAPATCEEDGRERAMDPPRVGDVVVSEVMADPDLVDDALGEWLEVFVARDLDLNGLAIGKHGEEPLDIVGSTGCVRVAAGTHVLFAASDDAARNGGLPARDFPLTLALSNDEGSTVPSVELRWGEVSLDVVTWRASEPGRAMNLDPDAHDPEANDDAAAFCDAQHAYGDGDFGSPGAANHDCLAAGECVDDGVARAIRVPRARDVIVTELMPQPEAVPHADGEWFELLAVAAFDLNGLELGENGEVEDTIESAACLPVAAGERLVFARETDPDVNGGLPRVDGTYGFALSNDDAFFVGHGGAMLHEVAWAESTAGASRSRDGQGRWCDAMASYGAGDRGTPGERNPSCDQPASCEGAGGLRPIVAPEVGDLVITEWMADPRAVGDERGEWFELLARADVDLNGLQIGRTRVEDELEASGACLRLRAGERVVLARSDMSGDNGGLATVTSTFSFGLVNDGGELFVAHGDAVIDRVAWSGSVPGVSWAVRPAFESAMDNDAIDALCPSGPTYGDGDRGTPGAENACE